MTAVPRTYAFSPQELVGSLRRGTRTVHAELEAKPVLAAMRATPPDLRHWFLGYQSIARAYADIAAALENSAFDDIDLHGSHVADVASAFRDDLARLDADGMLIAVSPGAPPCVDDLSNAIGTIWCLEGSRHGARVLRAHATRYFPEHVMANLQGLSRQHRPELARHACIEWRVRSFANAPVDQQAALEGALSTFEYFGTVAGCVEEASNGFR